MPLKNNGGLSASLLDGEDYLPNSSLAADVGESSSPEADEETADPDLPAGKPDIEVKYDPFSRHAAYLKSNDPAARPSITAETAKFAQGGLGNIYD